MLIILTSKTFNKCLLVSLILPHTSIFVVFDKNDRELLMRPYYSEVVGFNGIKAHRKMKSFKELFARKG